MGEYSDCNLPRAAVSSLHGELAGIGDREGRRESCLCVKRLGRTQASEAKRGRGTDHAPQDGSRAWVTDTIAPEVGLRARPRLGPSDSNRGSAGILVVHASCFPVLLLMPFALSFPDQFQHQTTMNEDTSMSFRDGHCFVTEQLSTV